MLEGVIELGLWYLRIKHAPVHCIKARVWVVGHEHDGASPGPLLLTLHPAPSSHPWPRSPKTLIHKVHNHSASFSGLLVSFCLVIPQGLWTQHFVWNQSSFGFQIFFSFLSDRVWWANVFWQADPRFEPLKSEKHWELKSQGMIFIQHSWVDSDVF